jgi:hypothetical protein
MRRRALVELGRIEEPALHHADHARDVAVTNLPVPLQRLGYRLQKRIPVSHRQWASRLEDSAELGVGKCDRRHGGEFRGGVLGLPPNPIPGTAASRISTGLDLNAKRCNSCLLVLSPGKKIIVHGGDEQMFGAEEQVLGRGKCD